MTPTLVQLIILVIFLALSAFFSSSETALTTVNRIRIKTMADDGNNRAKMVMRVTEQKQKMLSAVLIGNNVVNLSASSLATSLALHIFGNFGAGIATGILTLLILIFGEITPKTFASIHSTDFSLKVAGIIWILMTVFTPLIFIVDKLSGGLLRLIGVKSSDGSSHFTEDELRTIVDVSHENGVIEKDEKQYIYNLFDFSDATAREVMIPRIDMTMVNVNWSYEKLMSVFQERMQTRMPVYEDDTDHVIGILNMKDLLIRDDSHPFSIRHFLREAYFTFEQKNTAELFEEMRQNSQPMAIVLDEYGAVAGLITLEDLLEELVGEIRDEYDVYEEDDVVALSDKEYMVLGSVNLEDLCSMLPLHVSSDDYDTLGGFLVGEFDHFPAVGETYVTSDGIILRVAKVDRRRIEKVKIRFPEPVPADADSDA